MNMTSEKASVTLFSKTWFGILLVTLLVSGITARLGFWQLGRAHTKESLNAITEARSSTQPVNTRTGGSTFKNPDGAKAWELVDKAGCRGLTLGGAQVSEKHTNFLINIGEATSADIEALGEEVRRRVKDASGIELQWEIQRVGRRADADNERVGSQ
jgi:UDP-N-acetylenolpyruvoylglucosamine reductase